MTYTLNIQLTGITDPAIRRKLCISPEMTLYDLHLAIQAAMGWTNSHPYCFSSTSASGEMEILPPCDSSDKSLDARIKKHLSPSHPCLHYIYDFGDYWDHEITLESVKREVTAIPECIDGSGACPPENSGGVEGYMQAIESGQISKSQAETFSLDAANQTLVNVFLKSVMGD